jgi:hypothetical protein
MSMSVKHILGSTFAILFSLMIIGVAIYESWIVDTNGGAKAKCWQVWINTLLNCILNWILGFLSLGYSLASIVESSYCSVPISISIVLIVYHIWAMVIDVNINDKCKDTYKDDYPELWTAFQLEIILFFVYVSVVGIGCIGSISFCCYMCAQEDSDRTTNVSTSQVRSSSVIKTDGFIKLNDDSIAIIPTGDESKNNTEGIV